MTLARYLKFLVNGGVLGLASWCLQMFFFHLLGRENSDSYSLASFLSYVPCVLLNFSIQRRLIFIAPGCFSRFVLANIFMTLVVSALSPICREALVSVGGVGLGDHGGFILASLISATPSYLLSHFFVFNSKTPESSLGRRIG